MVHLPHPGQRLFLKNVFQEWMNVFQPQQKDGTGKGKDCLQARRPIWPVLNSCLCSMKQLGILLRPPGWDASPSQGYPPAL